MARDWRLGILAIYALATLGLMMDAGEPDQLWWWPLALLFLLWAVAPIALLCITQGHVTAKGIAALAIAAFGLWAFVQTMYIAAPDAQGGLIFLFAPLLQLGAALACLGVIKAGAWVKERNG
ncbi:hypothetical protein [Qipengyuania sphaerica]|uniref:hypothetical protein n=1 Tax=Qipengyuania sphaerica TaxID=2867243 RepID=UPI001C895FDB|nr:hypothetical protein [Qipengyuania sphaerica]MBX7542089.1 hypothetical protein [Qipengyuania sphaerica]